MAITVLKNNAPWGPFTRAQIQDGLARGDFTRESLAHVAGSEDWRPLGAILDYLDHRVGLPPVPGSSKDISSLPATTPPLPPVPSAGSAYKPTPPPLAPPAGANVPKSSIPVSAPLPEVPTPELRPARFFPRFIAFAIDCAVLFVPVIFLFGIGAVTIQLQGLWDHSDPETKRQDWDLLWQNFKDLLVLVAVGGAWLYAALLECSKWQGTVGKQWIGIKVVDFQGQRLSLFRATGRHVAKFISALPCFLGFTAALFSPTGLALHDRIARTRVVRK